MLSQLDLNREGCLILLKVFISSTITDLQFVRQTLGDKIEAQLDHNVVMSESYSFDWTGKNIIESCLKEVRNSDIYILVIGERYGSIIEEEAISITQAEYRQAIASKKPILIVITNETWKMYRHESTKLNEHLKIFISEVSSNFKRNIKSFSTSEEAFEYVRAQLSILLGNYVKSELHPSDIYGIIEKGMKYESYFRFLVSLISNGITEQKDYNRVLSSFSQSLQSEDINNNEYIPAPVLRLTRSTGSTLYLLSEDETQLDKMGSTGDVGGNSYYDLQDENSYVSQTFLSQESKLFENIKPGKQKEYIMCIPMAEKYILTLHFLVELEYQTNYEANYILDGIFNKNKDLFDIFNLYLEKSVIK
jgi:hypothetical protein